MKRLVICCDGTWNRPDAKHVTNIEKIARTVKTDLAGTGGVQQLVLYLSGVGGAGYHTDRLLGGAFGLGLFHNVLAGYRFLSLNYEPGDEIYVFGFSRGAYTARSLAGMVAKVGLLTRRALVQEKLPEAVERYKGVDGKSGKKGASTEEFKRDFCHHDTPIHFIGVFDTVGALGVPGRPAPPPPVPRREARRRGAERPPGPRRRRAADEVRALPVGRGGRELLRGPAGQAGLVRGVPLRRGRRLPRERALRHRPALDGRRGEREGARVRRGADQEVRRLRRVRDPSRLLQAALQGTRPGHPGQDPARPGRRPGFRQAAPQAAPAGLRVGPGRRVDRGPLPGRRRLPAPQPRGDGQRDRRLR